MTGRMRRRGVTAATLAAALVAGLLASAPAAAETFAPRTETYIVDTEPAKIYVEAVHPTRNDNIVRAPVVLTYSPFGATGRNRDADPFVEAGYTRVTADVIGTGNSGGCFDYGGRQERRSVRELVTWIARQPWSNGRVAMYGSGYDGATAIAAATARPRGLRTIIPVNAVSNFYGYTFERGMRWSFNNEAVGAQKKGPMPALNEHVAHAPVLFDGLALAPPSDPHNDEWAERVQSSVRPCNEIEHSERGYSDTPDYDGFWRQRDYVRDAGRIRVPMLIGHNWGNWNVKPDQPWNLFHAARNSAQKVLFMGSRWHGHTPPGGAGDPRFDELIMDWLDFHLKGRTNRVRNLPSVISQGADYDENLRWRSGRPRVRNMVLYAQEVSAFELGAHSWKLLPDPPNLIPGFDEPTEATFPATGVNLETHANHHPRDQHEWMWFESPLFRNDVRIFGEVKIQFYVTALREWVTLSAGLVDVDPGDHVMVGNRHVSNMQGNGWLSITRSFLDSRYRDSLARQKPIEPGKPFATTARAKPIDYTFKRHNYLGLNISSESLEWVLPKIYPCDPADLVPDPGNPGDQSCVDVRLNWEEGRFRVILPVVDAPSHARQLFTFDDPHDH